MADYTAFVEAGTALTELIRDQLTPEPISNRELISLCSPHESENNQLTLFLYHIEEEGQNVTAGYYQVDRELQRMQPAGIPCAIWSRPTPRRPARCGRRTSTGSSARPCRPFGTIR